MSKRKIKVVQIGVEHDHGPDTMKTMRRLTDDFEVLGYAVPDDDPNDNPIRNTVPFEGLRRYTVEEALSLPGVEAVTIECADEHLTKYALMAAKRGLAVHMDKPGGCDHVEFAELMKIVKADHIVLQTGYARLELSGCSPTATKRMFDFGYQVWYHMYIILQCGKYTGKEKLYADSS